MRPPKVENDQLMQGLLSVLRAKGYDGASLNELASSSGLQKASLYHRFPGGKQEIAATVLDYANKWVYQHIFQLLTDESIEPDQRLSQVIDNINTLYQRGEEACILRAMSMDTGIHLFGREIKESMQYWIEGFTALGIAFGQPEEVAQANAQQVLISIQGSLVVSKALNMISVFQSSLDRIKSMYQKT